MPSTPSTPLTQEIKVIEVLIPGAQGPVGARGPQGVSAATTYEQAVEGGYLGTELQFNADMAAIAERVRRVPKFGGFTRVTVDSSAVVADFVLTEVAGLDVQKTVHRFMVPSFGGIITTKINLSDQVIESLTADVWSIGDKSIALTQDPAEVTKFVVPKFGAYNSVDVDSAAIVADFKLPETAAFAISRTVHSCLVPTFGGLIRANVNHSDALVEALSSTQLQAGGAVIEFGQMTAIDKVYRTGTGTDAWFDEKTVLVVKIEGQSNALARNDDATDTLISSAPTYPANALMPNSGLRVTGAAITSLVPLVESIGTGPSVKESLASGLVNHLLRRINANMGFMPEIVVYISAKSGQTEDALGRGSEQWTNSLKAARDITTVLEAQGKKPYFVTIYVQGEAEPERSFEAYARATEQRAMNTDEDFRPISGQTGPVLTFVVPVATGVNRDLWAANFYSTGPSLAYARIANHPLIRICDPHYSKKCSPDSVHLSCLGQYLMGLAISRAIYGEFAGNGWTPFLPVDWRWVSSTILDIEFSPPNEGGLALVTTEAVAATVNSNNGFQAESLGVQKTFTLSIPAVPDPVIPKQRRLRFTFPAAITSPLTIAYALRTEAAPAVPIISGVGNLADDTQDTPLIGGTPQRNYAVPFKMTVPSPS